MALPQNVEVENMVKFGFSTIKGDMMNQSK